MSEHLGGESEWLPFGDGSPGGYKNEFNPSQINEALGHVRDSCEAGYPVLKKPWAEHDGRLCIVGGGPSINDTVEELRELVSQGASIACLNNVHDWLLENGLTPNFMVFLEVSQLPRMFDAPLKTCWYLIPSQADHTTFEQCRDGNIIMWHADMGIGEAEIVKEHHGGECLMIPGGHRAGLRSLNLGYALGYRRFNLFGMDSSFPESGRSHAYCDRKAEHRDIRVCSVGGRVFETNVGWARQADEFRKIIRLWGHSLEIKCHGDGLLPWIHKLMEPHRYAV